MKFSTFFDSPSNRTALCLLIGLIPPVATLLLAGSPKEIAVAAIIGQACTVIAKVLQPDNTVTVPHAPAQPALAAAE